MREVIVTATVLKKDNIVWYGRGRVISVDLKSGTATLVMETGSMKGRMGGFPLNTLKFRVKEG